MIPNHKQFLDAVGEAKMIRIEFYSKPDAATVDRECAPLDYGPGGEAGVELNRYWIWDYANPTGANPIGLVSEQIVSVQVLGKGFDPSRLDVARAWSVPRSWATRPGSGDQVAGVKDAGRPGSG